MIIDGQLEDNKLITIYGGSFTGGACRRSEICFTIMTVVVELLL